MTTVTTDCGHLSGEAPLWVARNVLGGSPGGDMFHLVGRAVDGARVFGDWREAEALWLRLVRALPGVVALVLMPNHVHALHPQPVTRRFGQALGSYAQWCNGRHGRRGPMWEPSPSPERITADKVHRHIRYIALNPCRARMVGDPLEWPFSTHRDAVGLAVPPVRPPVRDPAEHHRYVSGDPTVAVSGTLLPWGTRSLSGERPVLEDVAAAVSAVTRTPFELLASRPGPRRLYLRAARELTDAPAEAIAEHLGVGRSSVFRASSNSDPAVDVVARVLGDPRFPALGHHELPRHRWARG